MRRVIFGRRGIRPLLPILVLVGVTSFAQLFGIQLTTEEGINDLNRLAGGLMNAILVGAAILFSAVIIALIVKRLLSRGISGDESTEPTFRDHPWAFQGAQVRIVGRIEHIFEREKKGASRGGMFGTRQLPDTEGKQKHLRMLLSSPTLRRGERIVVIVPDGQLRVGQWVEVRAEYSHDRNDSRKRTFFGRRPHYYGYLHRAYAPRGDLRILDGKPARDEIFLTAWRNPPSRQERIVSPWAAAQRVQRA